MANEPTQVEGPYRVKDYTVSESVTIEKFTICKLSDPRTAAASSAADIFAGIAATEHEGSKGKTELGLWQTGTFNMTAALGGNTITAGAKVSLSGANLIKLATAAELLTGAAFGQSEEIIAPNTSGEVTLLGH